METEFILVHQGQSVTIHLTLILIDIKYLHRRCKHHQNFHFTDIDLWSREVKRHVQTCPSG